MKCTKCGHKLRIGDEFCSKCGTPIEPDIEYEENDVRDDRADREHTRAYRANRGDEHFEREHEGRFKKTAGHNDDVRQNMHDITGEINLDDFDPEDSRPRKASRWTAAGIAAAVGIAAAFVITIIAVNVQNIMHNNNPTEVGEAEETTATETVTEATTEETKSSGWKNPFESLFPSQREDSKSRGSSGAESSTGSDSYDSSDSRDSYSYETTESDHGQREDNYSSSDYYYDESDSSSSDTYDGGTSSDYYDGDTGTQDYSDENNETGGSSGTGVIEFFEGIGGQIRDTAEDIGTRLDESINNYRERMHGGGW